MILMIERKIILREWERLMIERKDESRWERRRQKERDDTND